MVRLLPEILQRFADQEMNGVAHVLKVLLRADVSQLEIVPKIRLIDVPRSMLNLPLGSSCREQCRCGSIPDRPGTVSWRRLSHEPPIWSVRPSTSIRWPANWTPSSSTWSCSPPKAPFPLNLIHLTLTWNGYLEFRFFIERFVNIFGTDSKPEEVVDFIDARSPPAQMKISSKNILGGGLIKLMPGLRFWCPVEHFEELVTQVVHLLVGLHSDFLHQTPKHVIGWN